MNKNKILYLRSEIKCLTKEQTSDKKELKNISKTLENVRKEFSEIEMQVVSLKEKVSEISSRINKRKKYIYSLEYLLNLFLNKDIKNENLYPDITEEIKKRVSKVLEDNEIEELLN